MRIYEDVGKNTIQDVLGGYNGTIFAYGPTGTGKTHTMFGDIEDEKMRGVVPRAASAIFNYIYKSDSEVDFVVKCSMLEIYREILNDLLGSDKGDLKIKDHPQKGIFVANLTETVFIFCVLILIFNFIIKKSRLAQNKSSLI